MEWFKNTERTIDPPSLKRLCHNEKWHPVKVATEQTGGGEALERHL